MIMSKRVFLGGAADVSKGLLCSVVFCAKCPNTKTIRPMFQWLCGLAVPAGCAEAGCAEQRLLNKDSAVCAE